MKKESVDEVIEDIIMVYGRKEYSDLCTTLQKEIVAAFIDNEEDIHSGEFLVEERVTFDEIIYHTLLALLKHDKVEELGEAVVHAALESYYASAAQRYREIYFEMTRDD